MDETLYLYQVKATNYPCAKAKRFARDFEVDGGRRCEEEVRCTLTGWTCRSTGTDDSVIQHRCARRDRVVRWRTEEG